MVKQQTGFSVIYKEKEAAVTEHRINSNRVFHVTFTDGRKPLVIAVAQDRQEKKFWTSIPQGRQAEAEEVGKQIAAYIRSKI